MHIHTHTHDGILLSHKKNILTYATTQMSLENLNRIQAQEATHCVVTLYARQIHREGKQTDCGQMLGEEVWLLWTQNLLGRTYSDVRQ